jgi:hypothetical protein
MPLAERGMMATHDGHPLARLAAALDGGPVVRLLPEGQLLISQGVVPTRTSGKAASTGPGERGFRVYVAVRTPAQHEAATAIPQRFTVPATPLPWHPAGRLRVTQETGIAAPLDEVNSILALIRSAVLV